MAFSYHFKNSSNMHFEDILLLSAGLGCGFYLFIQYLIKVRKRKERTVQVSQEEKDLLSWMLTHIRNFDLWLNGVGKDYRIQDDFIDCVELQYKTAILFEVHYNKGVFTKAKFRHLLLSEENMKAAETRCWKNFKNLIELYRMAVEQQMNVEQNKKEEAINEYSLICK
jgi:hypothetical protein